MRLTLLFLSLFITTTASLFAKDALRFFVIDGDIDKKYEDKFIPSLEESVGFITGDLHERIDEAYAMRYGNKKHKDYDIKWKRRLDNLGFFPISNDSDLYAILQTSPQIAGFSPFNLLIYKKSLENKTYVGHIASRAMLDITGVKNQKDRVLFIKSIDKLDRYIAKKLGGDVVTSSYDGALPSKPMMQFSFKIKRDGHLDDWVEAFQERFETAFEAKEYIIAGYKNFKESYEEMGTPMEGYDQFFVYGLCHFTFSYSLFNKGRPEAGAFAPCSMYFYIKKGSDTMVVGMPRLASWQAVINIQDKEKRAWIEKVDNEIVEIMKRLGGKEI